MLHKCNDTTYRATTPSHAFILPFSTEVIDKLKIIYSQMDNVILIKNENDATFDNHKIIVCLTQEETILFKEGLAKVQLRIKTNAGKVLASNKKTIHVNDVFDDEVM